jgi:molybdopterin-containing oxidoreductase family membrane subunit
MAYLLLAALSTPLVLSVHSVVSFDFATSVVPGWHTTIFPPYFVAGAIFGGFAMVLTIMVPARFIYGLQDLITMKHIDNMAKIILLTGTIVGYAYLMELFVAFYSGAIYEMDAFKFRIAGPYWWAYAAMMSLNVLSPQLFWFKACRENLWVIMAVAMCVNVGMWFERFVIIVTTLARMWLPGDWKTYSPSGVEMMTFVGTIGLFLALFMLFLKFLPCLNIAEVKWTLPQSDPHHDDKEHHPDHGIAHFEIQEHVHSVSCIDSVKFSFGDAAAEVRREPTGDFYLLEFSAPGTATFSQLLPAGREKMSDVLLSELSRGSRHPLFWPAIDAIEPLLADA